jgi:hypothetical protein
LSSTLTSYIRRTDQPTYSSVPLNAYAQSVNNSTGTHLAYYPTNPNSLTYISNPSSYHNHQTLVTSSYPNENYNFCCGITYANNSTYLPSNINDDLKINGNIYSDNDENNDSGIKSETSSNELKSTPPSSNDSNINFQEEKSRDSNSVKIFK